METKLKLLVLVPYKGSNFFGKLRSIPQMSQLILHLEGFSFPDLE